jgi:hypothetical protein
MENYNLGKIITEGNFRVVYNHSTNDNWVIKVLKKYDKTNCNQNIIEWKIWNLVKQTKYEKYFCPCIELSKCEKYLIMEKAETIPYKPYERMHPFKTNNNTKNKLNSIKIKVPLPGIHDSEHHQPHNWGIYNNNKVIIDYGDGKNTQLIHYLNTHLNNDQN